MAEITPYEVKGQKYYRLKAYLGIDPRTGKKKSITRSKFKTKKAAKLTLNKLVLEFEKSKLDPSQRKEKIKFEEVYKEWYASYITTVRTSTYRNVTKAFEHHILPVFGGQYLNTITINQIQKAVNQWFRIAPKYNYKKWAQYVANIFDFAINRGYYTRANPARAITLPKIKVKPGEQNTNFYSRDELKKFLGSLQKNDKDFNKYVFFRLLGYSGLRRGEALALEWKDVDFKKRTLEVNKTLATGLHGKTEVHPPKTNAGYRTIPLDRTTMNILQQWKVRLIQYKLMDAQQLQSDDALFPGRLSKYISLNTPRRWLKVALKTSGTKEITLHGFRKTYCTALVAAGLPIKEVQRRMGHDDIKTTLDVYSFVTKDQIDKATDQFEKYMSL